jgi:hypothetical protein
VSTGPRPRDVALAGVPRSGSTLACHLLNRCPETVALHEPFSLSELLRGSPRALADDRLLAGIDAFFARVRQSLLERGEAVSKHARGVVPDDPVGGEGAGSDSLRRLARRLRRRIREGRRLRRARVVRGLVRLHKPLSPDFLLCVKHPSIVSGLLPRLSDRYVCFATVRNPVAVLGSWNSVDFAVSDGRSRAAERLDPALRRGLRRCADRCARQLRLLEWYFERIARWIPPERVIRYEDVVESGGQAVARIAGAPPLAPPALENRNRSSAHDAGLVLALGERLLAAPGAWSAFYRLESLEQLLCEIDAARRDQSALGAAASARWRAGAELGERGSP